jgi:putative flippase GtrA
VFTLVSWLAPERDVVHAQALARLTGGLVAFVLHRSWSFRDQQGLGLTTEAGRFLALYVFSFCVSIATVYLLVDLLAFNRFLSKAFADTLCFVVNFIVMKVWVFSSTGQATTSTQRGS